MSTLTTAITATRARPPRPPVQRILSLVPAAIVLLLAVAGPSLVPFDPERVAGAASLPPGAEHWFGTDSAGLDVFSRTIAAFQIDVMIAVLTAVFATLLGIALGLIIGMSESAKGVWAFLARGIARVIDLMESIPGVILGLVAVALYGASVPTLVITMSIILCSGQTRLTRTEVLRVRGEAYLDAARMAGQSEARLTVRHVLPNACWAALQNASVIFAISIILTAALGFIGAGMPPPTAEWGAMLSNGSSDALVGRWWSAAAPAAALAFTVAAASAAAHAVFTRSRR